MLTGIGTPTAWPFFERGGGAVSPARTALGTNVGASAPTLTLAGINLAVGDLLLVATVNNNALSATTVVVDVDLALLTQDSQESGASDLMVTINSRKILAAVVGGTITAEWTVDDPNQMALLAVKVSGLAGTLREEASTYFAYTANPDSGPTGPYTPGFHWGVVGTLGKAADTLGTWQNLMTAGQRAASVLLGVDLKEGWRMAAVAARAQILLQSARKSVASVVYYE